MIYQEFLPAPPLRPYIKAYARLVDNRDIEGVRTECTPPFLSKAIIFFAKKNDIYVHNNVYEGYLPTGYILAQSLKSNYWSYEGGFEMLAIIFKPGMFRFFYPAPMLDFLDLLIDVEEFEEPGLIDLQHRIQESTTLTDRIQLADHFMMSRLGKVEPISDVIGESLQKLFLHPEKSLQEIRKSLPISERHFRRLFARQIGIPPKKYQKQIRFTKAVNIIQSGTFRNISDIAYQCGYSDTSRFIQQFKSFTQVTPKDFIKKELAIAKSIYYHE